MGFNSGFKGLNKISYHINIKTDLQEVGWGDLDWIDLDEDRNRRQALVNAVMNFRVP